MKKTVKLLLSEGEGAFKKKIAKKKKKKETNKQTNQCKRKKNSILETKCKSTNKASKVK